MVKAQLVALVGFVSYCFGGHTQRNPVGLVVFIRR